MQLGVVNLDVLVRSKCDLVTAECGYDNLRTHVPDEADSIGCGHGLGVFEDRKGDAIESL